MQNLQKIRYRLVFNRARRLNKRGEGLVQVECQQGARRVYFSAGVYVRPENWKNGCVVGCDLANDLNYILRCKRIEIERIELDFLKRDVPVSLEMIKTAVKEKTAPSARLVDFGREVIEASDRRDVTKANYRTLFNDLEKFRKGVRVDEVDYAFVVKYDEYLKESGVQHNTRIGRLRLLRAVLYEAVHRDIIAKNPFEKYRVQGMTSRHGFLTEEQVQAIAALEVKGRHAVVRDCFVFCCCTGLRYGDLIRLRSQNIQDGWIRLTMQKTGCKVAIPYAELFDGRAEEILQRWRTPERMVSQLPQNSQVNSILKDLLQMAKVKTKEKVTFHTSRHTFASLLLLDGVAMTSVQKMLGHTKVTTTEIYAEVTEDTIRKDLERNGERKAA